MSTNLRLSGSNPGDPREESDIRFNYRNLNQIICASTKLGGNQPIHYSGDGGKTWSQSSLPSVTGDVRQGDPAIDWTSDGTAWSLTIGISTNLVIRCFKSTDGGKTWAFDSTITNTQTAMDKESLWIDHSPGSPHHDNMYAVWHNGTPCFVSTRKGPGGTWLTPVQVSGNETTGSSDGGDIKTNGFGDVFAFWPDTGGSRLFVAKSTDGGASFGSPVQVASTFGSFQIGVPAQDGRRVLIYVSGGAYRTATENLVYATWTALAGGTGCNSAGDEPGSNTASTCKSRIWFTRSTDGGSTWETPKKLNDQNSLNDQIFQRLVVDETDGSLMVVYYDTVNDPNRIKTDLWMQSSVDNGLTWSGAMQITSSETDETAASAELNFQYGDYIGLTGQAGRFFACWTDRRGGGAEEIWGAPIAIPDCQFLFGKTTFGQDEVSAKASFPSAFFIAVDGFTNEALGFNNPSDLNSNPNPAPVITATVDASLNSTLSAAQIAIIAANLPTVNTLGPLPILADDSTLQEELQRFLYPYTISFPANTAMAFNTLSAHQSAVVTLQATFTVGLVTVSATALIELAKGEDPYFENLDPQHPQKFPSWLSFDLRFFKVTPNQSHQMFSVTNPAGAGDAVRYIQDVIRNLNNPTLITNGDTFDTTLQQDEEQSALEFVPNDKSGNPTFNFAVARVRILGNSTTTVSPVRVFFRLFNAASTVSTFDESTTYRWGSNGSAGHKIPLLGVQANQQGQLEWVTIPCFATTRVNLLNPADMHTQHDDSNARQITTVPGTEVDTYFGCWLDLNQPSQKFLIASPPISQSEWDGPWPGTMSINDVITNAPHQCLIAEIKFDDTPVPPGATTATSDKLAQRNIAWIDGPNPGVHPSRVMPHPFEIRASSASVPVADELMITWGRTPPETTASLYLPAVSSSDVIALADIMYPSHRLSRVDGHTIQCQVGGATFIPIPAGVGRYAGLLSVALPAGIRRGDVYDILVHQITEATVRVEPPPPRLTAASEAVKPEPSLFSWRQVSGTFQVTITISAKEPLLLPEERLLAWLKWKVSVIQQNLRWYPVLLRYLELVAGRVQGFGGDPGKILPSPTGDVPEEEEEEHEREERTAFTGKISGLVFDRFGDFEGFLLDTEDGERKFFSREQEIEELAERAWSERLRITVWVERDEPHRPLSIIVREPPAHFGH